MSLLSWKMPIKRLYRQIDRESRTAAINRTPARTSKLKDASPISTQITTLTGKTGTKLMRHRWAVFQRTFRDQIKSAQMCSTMTRPSSWTPTAVIRSSTRKHLSMWSISRLVRISRHTLAQRWFRPKRVITDAEAHQCIDRTEIGTTKTCKQLSWSNVWTLDHLLITKSGKKRKLRRWAQKITT